MLSHLIEFRQRALRIFLLFACLAAIFYEFTPQLFLQLIHPLLLELPHQQGLIATNIMTPFFTPIHLAVNTALLTITPFALYQLWGFIAPGLKRDERRWLGWMTVVSLGLFLLGMLFCFYWVLPFLFRCLIKTLPNSVVFMPDMGNAVDFITRMLLVFGLSFQVPLICVVLVKFNWLTVEGLKKARPYAIVGAFTLGMVLTPPDVLSQVMLALPLWLLYELGIFLAKALIRPVGHLLPEEEEKHSRF